MLCDFLTDLGRIAPVVGAGTYAFLNGLGVQIGFVQIIPFSAGEVTVHRIWTPNPRQGNGSAMLRQLCLLADKHGIVLKLKALPLGAKPYPFSREELTGWYQRHGFEGKHRKMIREPRRVNEGATTATVGSHYAY